MIYETYRPGAPLSRFVENLWFYDGFTPSHTKEKLLPNGSMELIIDLREHPKRLYDPQDFSRSISYKHFWLSGMQNGYIVIEASPGSMMGAHFRPGGAWPFFSIPLCEFTDKVVALDCVLGAASSSLRDRLLEAKTIKLKFQILEETLLQLGRNRFDSDRVVDLAVQDIMSGHERLRVKEIANKIGVSQKHLIHLFDKKIGITPKQLDRVVRFQSTIKTLERTKPREVDWPAVAVDCGYYDQSHFIHDFRIFAGMSPTGYLKQNWEYSNYVIVDPASASPQ